MEARDELHGEGRSRTLRRRRVVRHMLLCRRVGTSWWKRSGTSICTSPSRILKCPEFPWCRRRNSWWKCRNSCSWPLCSSSRWWCAWKSSRFSPWTGLFVSVGAEHGHFLKVHAQDRIQQRFREQSSLTFQFLKVVVEGEVFSDYAQIRIQLFHRPLAWCCG